MSSLKQKHHWESQPESNIWQVTYYPDHCESILVQKLLVDASETIYSNSRIFKKKHVEAIIENSILLRILKYWQKANLGNDPLSRINKNVAQDEFNPQSRRSRVRICVEKWRKVKAVKSKVKNQKVMEVYWWFGKSAEATIFSLVIYLHNGNMKQNHFY